MRSRWLDIGQVLFLHFDGFFRFIKTQKKEQGQSGSGSQSEHGIRFILPARGASHIIINVTDHFIETLLNRDCFYKILSTDGTVYVESVRLVTKVFSIYWQSNLSR